MLTNQNQGKNLSAQVAKLQLAFHSRVSRILLLTQLAIGLRVVQFSGT